MSFASSAASLSCCHHNLRGCLYLNRSPTQSRCLLRSITASPQPCTSTTAAVSWHKVSKMRASPKAPGGNLGVPTSVPVHLAHQLLLDGHRYLDVRTPEEFNAGHTPGATNIPYLYRLGSGMTKNPEFLAQVSSQFKKDDDIIVGCQLGKRSLMAATDLLAAGFSGVIDVAGGYAAWTQNGLPIEL